MYIVITSMSFKFTYSKQKVLFRKIPTILCKYELVVAVYG